MTAAPSLEGGFAAPVFGAQTLFRALMDALANPGQRQPLGGGVKPPQDLAPELAAIALTMCDHDTELWLDPVLAEADSIVAWLRFHTGAPLTADPGRAQFALVSDPAHLPAIDRFAPGTDEYPDRSTTIALALPSLDGGVPLTLRGPGINGSIVIEPSGLQSGFAAAWAANRSIFPRGIDLLLVANGEVIGLPRSTRLEA